MRRGRGGGGEKRKREERKRERRGIEKMFARSKYGCVVIICALAVVTQYDRAHSIVANARPDKEQNRMFARGGVANGDEDDIVVPPPGFTVPHLRYKGIPASDSASKFLYDGRDMKQHCSVDFFINYVDHFSYSSTNSSDTFKQRVFICNEFCDREDDGESGYTPCPVLFYTGNEANVELYLNANGLMWEHAKEIGARLVFAEHRYYGESGPYGDDFQFLTAEQALADYATIIYALRTELGGTSADSKRMPVITFGGSYGGMLSSWLRMKYTSAVDGAIAASAPILQFEG